MCKNRLGGFLGGLIAGLRVWVLLATTGFLTTGANAQHKDKTADPFPPVPPVSGNVPVPSELSIPSVEPRRSAAPKSISDLLADLSAIRAQKEELARAEKDTLAAIRARLKQQKEELAQLEKKLAELGIQAVEPTRPEPKPEAVDVVPALPEERSRGTSTLPLPPLGGAGGDKPR